MSWVLLSIAVTVLAVPRMMPAVTTLVVAAPIVPRVPVSFPLHPPSVGTTIPSMLFPGVAGRAR